jgi:cytochrome c peroxidase
MRARRRSQPLPPAVIAGLLLAALHLAGCTGGGPAPPAPAAPAAPAGSAAPPGETFVSGDFSMVLPLGLQAGAAYVPDENPLSKVKVDLGRMLYYDGRLSRDGTVSCATCHSPDKGFSDGRPTSTGIGAQVGGRNSPTVMNRLFSAEQFWDGRAADLEAQALGPIENPVEMGHTLEAMVADLSGIQGYAPLFEAAFGTPEITREGVAMAIASFERTVLAGNAPFDRHAAGDAGAMSEAAKRGMEIFNDAGRGNCVTCHAGFNFTDESYHNLGVGMAAEKPDLGRYEVTKVDTDRGAFKTPTLRNLRHSDPYMHDGSEKTLASVVELYNRGGVPNEWLSQEIHPLDLSEQDKADLVAFLEALNGEVTGTERPVSLPQ